MTSPAIAAGQQLSPAEAHDYLDRLEDGLAEARIGYSGIHQIREGIDAGRPFFAPFEMKAVE